MATPRRRSAPSGPSAPRTPGWIATRVVLAAMALAALSFAVQGGEYGTTDLFTQKRKLAESQAIVDSLQRRVDSLVVYKRLVETDPATQERIAREEFGMVKPGEVLYRFADPE
ncbi:MAG: septum formation initiator family protein [Gemmatimonadaceae bacterium]|nr:septum formation initiator family protein [Gemmatimonadaceae bacterium]MCW5827414.1 septum formation initiator family protein [Gemmatimonadaceae bacterium]